MVAESAPTAATCENANAVERKKKLEVTLRITKNFSTAFGRCATPSTIAEATLQQFGRQNTLHGQNKKVDELESSSCDTPQWFP